MVKMTTVVIGTKLYSLRKNPNNGFPDEVVEEWTVRAFWEENGKMLYLCESVLSANTGKSKRIFDENGIVVEDTVRRELFLENPKKPKAILMDLYMIGKKGPHPDAPQYTLSTYNYVAVPLNEKPHADSSVTYTAHIATVQVQQH